MRGAGPSGCDERRAREAKSRRRYPVIP
jgi:hypothetical protein